MIRFSLVCDADHDFDGWFASSEEFEKQRKRGLIACTTCNSTKVSKSLMAPQISTGRQKDAMAVASVDANRRELMAKMKELRETITSQSENVGTRFPEEVRKIHYGESEQRSIYGEAKRDEVESLLDEGVAIAPLPVVPDDAN
ncbi:MAG: DUF1178 family protein [Ahrensia sp.]|nr:DUF1178 family protein [Ahrensia sp.]